MGNHENDKRANVIGQVHSDDLLIWDQKATRFILHWITVKRYMYTRGLNLEDYLSILPTMLLYALYVKFGLHIYYFIFSFLLNLLHWFLLIKLYRFQVHSSTTHHLYIVLYVHHSKSSLFPSAVIHPLTFPTAFADFQQQY